jgi:hypothetical protein
MWPWKKLISAGVHKWFAIGDVYSEKDKTGPLPVQLSDGAGGTPGGSAAAPLYTQTREPGATNLASSQVALSTTAATVAIARATRRRVTVKNLDAAITVYLGPATVTSGNGMELKAGESVELTWVGLLQGIAASGTPSVAVLDEYD